MSDPHQGPGRATQIVRFPHVGLPRACPWTGPETKVQRELALAARPWSATLSGISSFAVLRAWLVDFE